MDTAKKFRNNLMTGILSQLITALLAVIVPKMVLSSFGSEVNGLISSVTQIYTYIALLEAGVGSATVQALYKVIGNHREENEIMAATNRYYHRTGILYLLAILVFAVVYPLVIQTEIPLTTIVLVILFNGLGSVINYLFQGKYFLLLQAEGKNYVQTTLNMVTNIIKNLATIGMIYIGCDVVPVQMISMLVSLIQMLYVTWYIRRYYSWIDLTVTPNRKAIAQSKNVLVHQVSLLIFSNTDMIVLSVFCGLKVTSVYSLYSLLLSVFGKLLTVFVSSITFSLGQSYFTDKEQFVRRYDLYEWFYITVSFALYSVANFFILPFLRIYTAGVSDINYIDPCLPLLFIATSLLANVRSASSQAINVAGHFKRTQYRSIAESVINLAVSLVLVNVMGIYGVLLGTIAALLYRSNDMILYTAKHILNRSAWITYKRWGVALACFLLVLFVNQFLPPNGDTYLSLVLYSIPYAVGVFALFGIAATLTERPMAKLLLTHVKRRLKRS